MDILSKLERSKRMSLIRSKWTKQEVKVHNFLKGRKVPHKMHPKLPGSPDLQIGNNLISLHGCFWHKCPSCYREPASRKEFWAAKVWYNTHRHDRNVEILKKMGYKTKTFWEHEIKTDLDKVLKKIQEISYN